LSRKSVPNGFRNSDTKSMVATNFLLKVSVPPGLYIGFCTEPTWECPERRRDSRACDCKIWYEGHKVWRFISKIAQLEDLQCAEVSYILTDQIFVHIRNGQCVIRGDVKRFHRGRRR
jgi:hypothetical protein